MKERKMCDNNLCRVLLKIHFSAGSTGWFTTSLMAILLMLACFGGRAQNGSRLFDDTFLHKVEFQEVDTTLIGQMDLKGVYQKVNMIVDGHPVTGVGLATKGEKSWMAAPNNKKPFKIKTDRYVEGQKYDGIKRFNLHNNTYDKAMMREKLTCDASLALGIPAPRIAFAEVTINGSFWGVYTVVEAQDEIYKRTFGDNDGYAMESFGGEANLLTLMYYGDHPDDYKGHYVVDHGNDSIAWSKWVELLYKIQSLPARVHYVDSISRYIDYQSYFGFNAMLDYNLNAESKDRNGIFYYDINQKKWMTICWDQNVAFADFTDATASLFPNTQCTAFLDKYGQYARFSNVYDHTLCTLVHTLFTDSVVDARIKQFRKIIDGAVDRDVRKGFTYKQYELSIRDLVDFIATRNQVTDQFLKGKNCDCNTTGIHVPGQDKQVVVYPNPCNDRLYIHAPGGGSLEYSISNLQGAVVMKGLAAASPVDISRLLPGLYVLELTRGKSGWARQKIMVKR